MILLLIGILISITMAIVFFIMANDDYEWYNTIFWIFGIILGGFSAFMVIVFCIFIFDWQAAEYRVKIINREYGTSYTREEVFYAHDVIDTIRELDRKRVEINGDIMRGKGE
jgi:hypothetical protein